MLLHGCLQCSLQSSFSILHGRSQHARPVSRTAANLPPPCCSQSRALTTPTVAHDASKGDPYPTLMAERMQSQQTASTSGRVAEELGNCWPAASTLSSNSQSSHRQGKSDSARVPKSEAWRSRSQGGKPVGWQVAKNRGARSSGVGGRGRQASGRSARQPAHMSVHISSFLEAHTKGLAGKEAEEALAAACLGAAKAGCGGEAVMLLRQMKPEVMLTEHSAVHALIRVRFPCKIKCRNCPTERMLLVYIADCMGLHHIRLCCMWLWTRCLRGSRQHGTALLIRLSCMWL